MGNSFDKYARTYVADHVHDQFQSQFKDAFAGGFGGNQKNYATSASGGSSASNSPAGDSASFWDTGKKDSTGGGYGASSIWGGAPGTGIGAAVYDTLKAKTYETGEYANNARNYAKDKGRNCWKRTCSGPVSYFGDPTMLMSIGLWSLRFGFPVLGWFFFVAIGKFAAGAGSAFLIFYLFSKVDLYNGGGASHAPEGHEADLYRCPEWLSTHRINFAVAGVGGVGKSTLINTLRGIKAKDPLAAKVGPKETTMEPTDYRFPSQEQPFRSLTNLDKVSLWDLPGVGTEAFPAKDYIRAMGLRYFDGVLIVTAERFTQNDIMLMTALLEFDVPFYMIRNKTDQALEMEFKEYGRTEADVLQELRDYYKEQRVDKRLFLLSAAKLDQNRLDFDELLFQIATDLSTHRKLM